MIGSDYSLVRYEEHYGRKFRITGRNHALVRRPIRSVLGTKLSSGWNQEHNYAWILFKLQSGTLKVIKSKH